MDKQIRVVDGINDKKKYLGQVLVAHAYNPSYSGGRD
jgi:hypothetical protein